MTGKKSNSNLPTGWSAPLFNVGACARFPPNISANVPPLNVNTAVENNRCKNQTGEKLIIPADYSDVFCGEKT